MVVIVFVTNPIVTAEAVADQVGCQQVGIYNFNFTLHILVHAVENIIREIRTDFQAFQRSKRYALRQPYIIVGIGGTTAVFQVREEVSAAEIFTDVRREFFPVALCNVKRQIRELNRHDGWYPRQRIDVYVPVVKVRFIAVFRVKNYFFVQTQPIVHLKIGFDQDVVTLEFLVFSTFFQIPVLTEISQRNEKL